MRFITIVLLILILGCSQDDPSVNEVIDVCSDDIGSSDTEKEFGADINNESWEPDFKIFATYYGGSLSINATDSGTLEEMWRTLDIQINNPVVGLNDVSYSSLHYLSLCQIENRRGFTGFVSCGYVNLTKLDTINGIISGYFQGVFEIPDNKSEVSITNGVFNDLELATLFCEPNYLIETGDNNLFTDWQVIGIYDNHENIVTFSACNSINTLTFNSGTLRVTGSLGDDPYWADLSLISNSIIGISPFGTFRGAGNDHEIYFQRLYFEVLSGSELIYKIENNILTLTNSKSGRMVKCFLKK